MKKPRTYPIESFGSEILDALIKGSKEAIRVPFPTYSLAHHFAMRLSQLRSQMTIQQHPLASVVARAKFSIDWWSSSGATKPKLRHPHDRSIPAVVLISPRDSEFASVLRAAGLTGADLGHDVLADLPNAAPAKPTGQFHDFLDQFEKKGD